jgi:hypothetical protein
MAFELKDGQGTLHKNDKQGNETWADYRGEIVIDGTSYWLSAWIKQGKNGKWMSLAAKPKDDEAKPAKASKSVAKPDEELSDDIPF